MNVFRNSFFTVLLIVIVTACSDGDITIASIDFNDIALESCDNSTNTTLFFKINDTETIVLELATGLIVNSVSEATIESEIPAQSKLTYRIFSETIEASYYCNIVPTISPQVLKNAEAASGSVLINTVLNVAGTGFEHQIQLSGITFIDEDGKRITDLNVNDFGTFTTLK